ncbi:MAG: hypothetical protein VW405_04355 [Rhodospirillaceae bacterium]
MFAAEPSTSFRFYRRSSVPERRRQGKTKAVYDFLSRRLVGSIREQFPPQNVDTKMTKTAEALYLAFLCSFPALLMVQPYRLF